MHPSELFVHTVNEIGEVIETPTNYSILRSSALLRQLLVDGNRLVDVANREPKLKMTYVIADSWETPYVKFVLESGAVFYAVLDGLSPETAAIKAPIRELSRDQFLSHRVVLTKGKYITVRDIIDHCANVMGGVHFGSPKDESQVSLSELQSFMVGGAQIGTRQLLPILRIVHNALQPLCEALKR
jgi:hypothetical protein